MLKNIFEKQDWHFALLALLVVSVNAIMVLYPLSFTGVFWGLSTGTWLWIGVFTAILHQIYIMLIWRIQLETRWLTTNLPRLGFIAYLIDYTLMLAARTGAIILVAAANREVIFIPDSFRWVGSIILGIVFTWLTYSVTKSSSYKDLAGAVFFESKDPNHCGIQKNISAVVPGAVYIFGPLSFYIPGLVLASPASLLLALFNHIYIWIHYCYTEAPSLKRVYSSNSC